MRSFAPPSPGGDRKGPDVDQPKVGVIVPMYNAAATIDATLESVCAQSYRNLDIVVVDDGGTDASAQIVEARIARDPRIRLVRKLNGGVATARNFGAAATDAPYLAFVDSDDLWAPDKIAAQMAALAEDPDVPALVYCSYIHIDGDGRAFPGLTHHAFEGRVLHDLYRSNFVGNGSSMLMPREIFDHVGGFDPGLRAQKAQGCEDLLFLLRAAEAYPFRVVPRYFVGYRVTQENMSSDTLQMLRSFDLVRGKFQDKDPSSQAKWDEHRYGMILWLAMRNLAANRVGSSLGLVRLLFAADPMRTCLMAPDLLRIFVRAKLPRWVKTTLRRLRPGLTRPLYKDAKW
jgi:glycosyltransferase involved in cell wall biosynthesis